MAAFAEDLIFGDFSEEEYHALFRDPLQSVNVEFPWDDKTLIKPSCSQVESDYGSGFEHPPPGFAPHQAPLQQHNPVQGVNDGISPQQDPAYYAGNDNVGPSYNYQGNYMGAEASYENPQGMPNEWNSGPAASNVLVDYSQDQSSDGATGNDTSEEQAQRRRNKKRRDPDHYKKYMQASFDSDSKTESVSAGEGDNGHYYSGNEPPMPTAVPATQVMDSVCIDMPPDPGSYEYDYNEKDAERTNLYMQSDANASSIRNQPSLRTNNDYYNVEYGQGIEQGSVQDATQQFAQMDVSAPAPIATSDITSQGNISYAKGSEEYIAQRDGTGASMFVNPEQMASQVFEAPSSAPAVPASVDAPVGVAPMPVSMDPPAVASAVAPPSAPTSAPESAPAVPTIHISPSESTASNELADSVSSSPAAKEVEVVSQPAAPAPAAPPAVKSWASLFKGGSAGQSPGAVGSASVPIVVTAEARASNDGFGSDGIVTVPTDQDPRARKLGDHLSRVTPSHHPMNLQPRGLINTANWCYINSILQALLSCPPFYHIMRNLPLHNGVRKSSSTPMLDAMYQFLQEFHEQKGLSKRATQDIRPGLPFEPTNIYQMLSVAQTSLAVKQGRQEDAEEFLSCLLNGLHDEMTSLIQSSSGEENQHQDSKPNGLATGVIANGGVDNGSEDDDEWEQVGPRNKSSITRQAQFSSSPLSKIFGGIMRSALHQHGSKESATLQPFFSLQLDIQSSDIWTVQDALNCLGNKESVHGFMSNKTKKEVEAFRRISLEQLPPVLILHLKRFLYDKSGGCQKLMKKVEYGIEIEISKDLISPNAKSRLLPVQRLYKLFAVVYHTGKDASGGHYITDVYHVGTTGWLRCDDSIVKPVKQPQVTKPQSSWIPYLLFYRRKDLLTKPVS